MVTPIHRGFVFMDIQNEIAELKSKSVDEILKNKALKVKFISLYENVFNDKISDKCKSCLRRKLVKLFNTNNKQIIIMATRKFNLKKNSVIWIDRLQMHITNDNLTDELALKLLAINKGYKKFFENMPVGWEQEINKPVAKIPVATPKIDSNPIESPIEIKPDYKILESPKTDERPVTAIMEGYQPTDKLDTSNSPIINAPKKRGRPKKSE